MNLFSQILNQVKLGTPWQFSGGTSFGSINTQDFQSKLPEVQKSIQAENNMRNQWFSDKEIKFLKLQKDKGADSKMAMDFIMQKRQEEAQKVEAEKWILGSNANREWFMQNALGVWADLFWGAISEVPSFLGNTAEWMSKQGLKFPTNTIPTAIRAWLSDKTYWELRAEQNAQAEQFWAIGQKWKELVQSTGLYDPTTLSAKWGELVTDIAGSLVWPNKVGILKTWAKALWVGKKLATGAKIGDMVLEWWLAWAKLDIGSKWKITPESVIAWWILWPTVPLVWKVIWKWWEIVKKTWKALYKSAIKPTAQEARQIISTEAKLAWATKEWAKKIQMPVTRADTALKYGITGTEKGIAVKWQTEANKIFKKVINPALAKSKAEHSVDDIFAKVEQQIAWEKSVLRKKELMDWLSALKEDYLSTGKKIFSTADLQAEKSMLDEFTPTKIFQGKEVAQGYNQVKNYLANTMREQVREDLWKVWVKNAKALYKDYANLSALEDIGVKWITEWGLKWGFGTFWSTIYDKIATPVKTVWWKYIYKLGNWVEYVWPKWMDTLGKYLKSKWYKMVGWNIINLSKNVNPALVRGAILSSGSSNWMD